MEFYFFIAILFGAASVFSGITSRRTPALNTLLLIIFWSIAALRYDTGYDWLVYKNYFNQFFENSFGPSTGIVPMEPLYRLANYLIAITLGDFQFIFLAVATFNTWAISKLLKEANTNKALCLFLYFCTIYLAVQMGVTRQSIAISFFLLAILEDAKENRLRALVFCLLGIGFHYSAAMYLLVFLRGLTRKILRSPRIFCGILLTIYISGIGLASLLIETISRSSIPFISEKIAFYLPSGLSSRTPASAAYLLISMSVFLWTNSTIRKKNRFQELLFGAIVLQIALESLFFDVPLFWNRVQYLAVLPQAILLSQTIDRKNLATRAVSLAASCAFGVALLTYQLTNPLIAPYIPYYSYLEYMATGYPGTGMDRAIQYYETVDSAQEQ